MATYIPNATQTTEPVESRTVESAALEFRTLKASINARVEDVQDNLDTEIVNRIAGDANLQTQNNAQDVRLTAIENALLSIGEGGLPGTVYVQRLSGTGAQTVFTLNAAPQSGNVVDIYINGIYQNKDTFTVSGADVTFSEAPPAGTDNIEVQVTVTIALGETDASLVDFQQAGAGSVVRTAQDKMREWVSVKDFGVVGDGVADDTLPLVKAMNYCRLAGKTLLIEGRIVFNRSSIPSEDIVSGNYVNACSMMALTDAELLVNGKIGFLLTGVARTLVSGIKVITTGREMTESEQNNTSPALFFSSSGTKTSAIYRDITVYNTVTNLTGAYRAGAVIQEYGCESVLIDNIVAKNTICVIMVFLSSNVSIRNIYGYNVETNIYLASCQNFQITNSHLINDATQRDYWIGRTGSPARQINGMDNVLTEQCGNGTVLGLRTIFAIERACYIQATQLHISDCLTVNCDGYKVVGNSYTSRAKDLYVNNCHSIIDAGWSATRGRSNLQLLTSYWASNLNFQNCSIRNDVFGRACIQAVVGVGMPDGSTAENIFIKNVTAINAVRFMYASLTSRTAEQLAALTPAGSFVVVRNVAIENCFIKDDDFRTAGALIEFRDIEASADALVNYAAENLQFRNNTIELPTTEANRDDWIFDVRYVNGAISENNKVNLPFAATGFFASSVTRPHANIRMNEPYLKHVANLGNFITQLGNLSVAEGSALKFTRVVGGQHQTVEAVASKSGVLLGQRVVAEIFGKGYALVTTNRDFALEMNARGSFYFGKTVAGTKTDQVSVPPVDITVNSTSLQVRGDFQPTVEYHLKMTLV